MLIFQYFAASMNEWMADVVLKICHWCRARCLKYSIDGAYACCIKIFDSHHMNVVSSYCIQCVCACVSSYSIHCVCVSLSQNIRVMAALLVIKYSIHYVFACCFKIFDWYGAVLVVVKYLMAPCSLYQNIRFMAPCSLFQNIRWYGAVLVVPKYSIDGAVLVVPKYSIHGAVLAVSKYSIDGALLVVSNIRFTLLRYLSYNNRCISPALVVINIRLMAMALVLSKYSNDCDGS